MTKRNHIWAFAACLLILALCVVGCKGQGNSAGPIGTDDASQNNGTDPNMGNDIITVDPSEGTNVSEPLSPQTDGPSVTDAPESDAPTTTNAPTATDAPKKTTDPEETKDPLEIEIPITTPTTAPTPTPTPKPGETAAPTAAPTDEPTPSPTLDNEPIELPELP